MVFDIDAHDTPTAAASTEAPVPAPVTEDITTHVDGQLSPTSAHFEELRKQKATLNAKVLKWARNGLEVSLEDGTVASMPNNHIDLDPDRNIAKYFGKTLPVRVLDVRHENGADHVRVSHRMVLEEELRKNAKDTLEHLNVGDTVDVKVKSFNIKDVVLDMGPGVEAVILGKDLSWQRFNHPYEICKRGETLKAKVLEIDNRKRFVRFGVKQLTPDPMVEKFAGISEGDVVNATVVSIVDQGAEVSLPNGIVAFLPISEISWDRIPTVSDGVSMGEEFEVKLLTIEPKRHRVTCSKKRLIENPARQREETYRLNSDHNATIKEVTKGGLVVTFEDGNEGFVPRRELSHDRIERLEDVFRKDKPIEGLRVIEYDRRNGKIVLSLIAAEKEAQRTTLRQYRATSSGSSFTLGELGSLKEKLEAAERGE
ncbi:MAG: 30S ribosomal protein S1 [Bacteroidetes bacterium]|nr:30S ribosomal protein S1 [Bacteroidota bacterium]